MGGKVDENPAALRAAVFSLSSKNLRGGGGGVQTPPPAGRGFQWTKFQLPLFRIGTFPFTGNGVGLGPQ